MRDIVEDPYVEFLTRKQISAPAVGIEYDGPFPAAMKDFQRDVTRWALRRGRAAIFAGTGTGKTLCQLLWASVVADYTGRSVLILTPLAVAQQTVAEAAKFGISDVAYAADQSQARSRIVVTNYDRVEKFDMAEYAGIVMDESSIIKAQESQTRALLIDICRDIQYRLCCTATPAPNDYVELGNHAEFLGVMTAKEMLSMWFVHDGGIRAQGAADVGKPAADWRLKRHAEKDFWRWLSTWAAVFRKPSDLGYDDTGYDLPPLIRHQITVSCADAPIEDGMMFAPEARTLQDRIGARRDSIEERCRAAAAIVNAQPDRPWLVWCHLNAEADLLRKLIPDALEVRGSDDRDLKAERLLGFVHGKPRVLLSKPSIAGMGLNYQHCADQVFVGLSDSFEELYQAIRRCWRFGQTRPVNAYIIASEREGAVVKNIAAKEAAYDRMHEAMAEHMKDLCRAQVRGGRVATVQSVANRAMEIPGWLRATA